MTITNKDLYKYIEIYIYRMQGIGDRDTEIERKGDLYIYIYIYIEYLSGVFACLNSAEPSK